MLRNIRDRKEARDAMLALMPTASTLAGLSVGLVSVVKTGFPVGTETIVDDLFLFAAIGFLAVCYLLFFAMRRLHGDSPMLDELARWTGAIDAIFLASLTLMVVGGMIVVYRMG